MGTGYRHKISLYKS